MNSNAQDAFYLETYAGNPSGLANAIDAITDSNNNGKNLAQGKKLVALLKILHDQQQQQKINK